MSDYYYPPEDPEPDHGAERESRRFALDRLKDRLAREEETQAATHLHEEYVHGTPRSDPGRSGWYIPWWGFAIVILIVAGITCGLWGIVLLSRGDAATNSGPTPTAIIVVITATPTLGPAAPETPDGTAQGGTPGDVVIPGITPTGNFIPIAVGRGVVIAGTEGDGLSIRQGPGLSFTTFFVGNDGDLFVVQDGPREADGYTWWYIVDPNDPNRSGWSVDLFLEVSDPS